MGVIIYSRITRGRKDNNIGNIILLMINSIFRKFLKLLRHASKTIA